MSDLGMESGAGISEVLDVSGISRRDLAGGDERPFEALSDWLAAGWVEGASTVSERGLRRELPPMRLTSNRLHALADETELRARTLAWMIEARRFSELSARKVQSLFEIAGELRRMAERFTRDDDHG